MKNFCGLFLLLFVFGLYLFTLNPTIPFHDSGDMVSASWLLGIPHPTGYPLYSLFGRLFSTIIPIGNIAYRMNMESALFASIAVMLVYFIILRLTIETQRHKGEINPKSEILNPKQIQNSKTIHSTLYTIHSIIPSIVASLMLAFSATFWEQAVIAEKYTLNALFFSLLVFILLKWQETINPKFLYLFAFILGLSFCHHMQTSFIVPASIFFIIATLWNHRSTEAQRHIGTKAQRKNLWISRIILDLKTKITHFPFYILLFLFPLLLYAYLPIRSFAHPFVNWGDPDRIGGFLDYITAKGYAHYFEQSSVLDHLKRAMGHWKTTIPNQFGILFLPALSGVFLLLIRKKRVFGLFLLVVLANTAHCSHYNIPNVWDYYIPTYIILTVGLSILLSLPFSAIKHKAILLLFPFLILIPILHLSKNIKGQNRSKEYDFYDEGMAWLSSPAQDAIVLTKGDICFILWYLHYVENVRSDLFLINGTFLHCHWLIDEITRLRPGLIFDKQLPEKRVSSLELANVRFQKYREIMEKNINRYPIYTPFADDITTGFRLLPEGLFQRVLDKSLPDDEFAKLVSSSVYDLGVYQKRSKGLSMRVKDSYVKQGVLFSEMGRNNEAIESFKKAKKIDPKDKEVLTNLSKCYYNLGLSFDGSGNFALAKECYEKAIGFDPKMIDAIYNLGLLYHKRGDSKNTLIYWKKILEIDPTKIKTRENIATVYYNSKDFRNAAIECKRILKDEPQNQLASNMIYAIKMIAPGAVD
jgi:tetratricopeptide (TPR) repeat protein